MLIESRIAIVITLLYTVLSASTIAQTHEEKSSPELVDEGTLQSIATALLSQDEWAIALVRSAYDETVPPLSKGNPLWAKREIFSLFSAMNGTVAILQEQIAGTTEMNDILLICHYTTTVLQEGKSSNMQFSPVSGSTWLVVLESTYSNDEMKAKYLEGKEKLDDTVLEYYESLLTPRSLWELGDVSRRTILLQWAVPRPAPSPERSVNAFVRDMKSVAEAFRQNKSMDERWAYIIQMEDSFADVNTKRVLEIIALRFAADHKE